MPGQPSIGERRLSIVQAPFRFRRLPGRLQEGLVSEAAKDVGARGATKPSRSLVKGSRGEGRFQLTNRCGSSQGRDPRLQYKAIGPFAPLFSWWQDLLEPSRCPSQLMK
jgi:hypothetical protein